MRRALVALALALLEPGRGGAGEIGPICDDPAIVGEAVHALEGPGGCGIAEPVRVLSLAGVALMPAPTITCGTARALRTWITEAAKPALTLRGERLDGLGVAAAYICRNVNRAEGGELSEHAFGRAIDISVLHLEGGETLGVLKGWGTADHGRMLRGMLHAACGPFGTVLGPPSDRFHRDHFHLDIAARRRPYCPEGR